jgi:hypothetical protein
MFIVLEGFGIIIDGQEHDIFLLKLIFYLFELLSQSLNLVVYIHHSL